MVKLNIVSPVDGTVAEICLKYGNKSDTLLEILHDVQHELGYVPEGSLPTIANALNLSRAEVYGVVTFYHDYRLKPQGKHVIKICRSEACQSTGGFEVIAMLEKLLKVKLGETTADRQVTLEGVYCLGLCPMGPAALINGKAKAALNPDTVEALIKELV